jgi:hypothetical protein
MNADDDRTNRRSHLGYEIEAEAEAAEVDDGNLTSGPPQCCGDLSPKTVTRQ